MDLRWEFQEGKVREACLRMYASKRQSQVRVPVMEQDLELVSAVVEQSPLTALPGTRPSHVDCWRADFPTASVVPQVGADRGEFAPGGGQGIFKGGQK